MSTHILKVGLLINPWAGIGGQVALKGSDGINIVNEALKRGATPSCEKKVEQCFTLFKQLTDNSKIQWICAPGEMGGHTLKKMHIPFNPINYNAHSPSTSADTIKIAQLFIQEKVDLILFAGGDGTARDLYTIIGNKVPVLGIPAGVKIHSGVYAITPQDAARCLAELTQNPMMQITEQEVRDINEEAFRANKVQTRFFGLMHTPSKPQYIQAVKSCGIESDELLNEEIADFLIETLDENTLYFIGSGKTLDCMMQKLNLPNTLLGVDAIMNQKIIQSDLTANNVLNLMQQHTHKLLLSVIGGQGHIFGRGNHQFNQSVLEKLSPSNLTVIAHKRKLLNLNNRPLIIDSFDENFKNKLNNRITILTGYDQWVSYPIR